MFDQVQRCFKVAGLTFSLLCVVVSKAQAGAEGFRLRQFSMDGHKHWHLVDVSDAELPEGEYWTYGVATLFDLQLFKLGNLSLDWDNRVQGDSTNRQFRRVFWEYEQYFNWRDRWHLGWYHKSDHVLDLQQDGYLLEDRFFIRWRFYP